MTTGVLVQWEFARHPEPWLQPEMGETDRIDLQETVGAPRPRPPDGRPRPLTNEALPTGPTRLRGGGDENWEALLVGRKHLDPERHRE